LNQAGFILAIASLVTAVSSFLLSLILCCTDNPR
jgi:hypothetical protein